MSETAHDPITPAVRRGRSRNARAARRAEKAARDERIVDLLNRGLTVASIAERERLSITRMRGLLQEVLARREPRPPDAFVARELGRLNAALRLSYDAMVDPVSGANFEAIGRLVKTVRALDPYNGFFPPGRAARAGPRRPKAAPPRAGDP